MKRLPPLNALRAFHVAAQQGSFTKAGAVLHVAQGAISRQVKLLEDVMGRPLFFRVHQGIAGGQVVITDRVCPAFHGGDADAALLAATCAGPLGVVF
jgi:hypothetical protein